MQCTHLLGVDDAFDVFPQGGHHAKHAGQQRQVHESFRDPCLHLSLSAAATRLFPVLRAQLGSERERAWEEGKRERGERELRGREGLAGECKPVPYNVRPEEIERKTSEGGRARPCVPLVPRRQCVTSSARVTTRCCVCRFPVFWSVLSRSHDIEPRCAPVPPSSETCNPPLSGWVCVCLCRGSTLSSTS